MGKTSFKGSSMKLKTGSHKTIHYVIAVGIFLLGLILCWYGFELVSIPHLREYSESVYILAGLLIMGAGIAYGVMRARRRVPAAKSIQDPSPQ